MANTRVSRHVISEEVIKYIFQKVCETVTEMINSLPYSERDIIVKVDKYPELSFMKINHDIPLILSPLHLLDKQICSIIHTLLEDYTGEIVTFINESSKSNESIDSD